MHQHSRPVPRRPSPPLSQLIAEWQSGEVMFWTFTVPTRVEGFEVEEPIADAVLRSIQAANQEQLVTLGLVPLVALVQWHVADAVSASPAAGWKIGPLMMPALNPQQRLKVAIARFAGRLRPFGTQLR